MIACLASHLFHLRTIISRYSGEIREPDSIPSGKFCSSRKLFNGTAISGRLQGSRDDFLSIIPEECFPVPVMLHRVQPTDFEAQTCLHRSLRGCRPFWNLRGSIGEGGSPSGSRGAGVNFEWRAPDWVMVSEGTVAAVNFEMADVSV